MNQAAIDLKAKRLILSGEANVCSTNITAFQLSGQNAAARNEWNRRQEKWAEIDHIDNMLENISPYE